MQEKTNDKANSEFWLKAKLILFALFTISAFILFYFSLSIVIITLIGIGIGVLLAPILSFLRVKFKIPRALSALLCFIFILLAVGGVSYATWYLVSDQVDNLVRRAPEISANLKTRFSSIAINYPQLQSQFETLDFVGTAQNLAARLFNGLQASFVILSGLLFALILGLYTAVAIDEYFAAFVRAFPSEHREKTKSVLHRCAKTLRSWFRAQVTDMLILGVLTAIALRIVGVEYWAVYGLLTALFGIVPYLGTMLIVAIASLITLASDPDLVPWVLVVFVVIQQIEGNIILPLLMKGQAELPEVPLLIFILLVGSWLGIVGVFLAPPLFAIIRVVYLELYLPRVDTPSK